MGRHSLRVRIALAVAVVSLLVSSLVGVALAQQADRAAVDTLRDQTLGQLDTATAGYRVDGRLRAGATTGEVGPPSLREGLAEGDRRSFFDGSTMWAAERVGEDIVLTVHAPADDLVDAREARRRGLAAAIIGSGLASGALGWWAATALSRRLRRAAATAGAVASGSVAAGEPGARTFEGGRDEVAVLTRAVDDMADRLSARLEAEKAFTADVAHELRTPLTGLVSAAELLPDDEASDLVREQVARMRGLVEDLLEISRLERGAEAVELAPVDLADAVRRLLGRTLDALPSAPEVELEVGSSSPVLVEERRLERVLHNLVANLGRHGGGRARLLVDGTRLVLEDDGPGYPAELIASGPQRFHGVGATKGSGLGLTIAARQLEAMGGRLELGRAEPPCTGARTTVLLQPVGSALSA